LSNPDKKRERWGCAPTTQILFPSIMMAHVLTTVEKHQVPVRLLNMNVEPITLPAGTVVGVFEEVPLETNIVETAKEDTKLMALGKSGGRAEVPSPPLSIDLSKSELDSLQKDQLRTQIDSYCLIYLDDVLIFSPTFERHLKDLTSVFQRLQKANLQLRTDKCFFARKEVKYLGHIVSKGGEASLYSANTIKNIWC
jgi:hypothetical protein